MMFFQRSRTAPDTRGTPAPRNREHQRFIPDALPHHTPAPVHRLKTPSPIQVLHEDQEILVVRKPAGLVCHPTKGDAWSSLISRVRIHLGADEEPQMVHRLDRETSGVMVFGKTPDASAELRRLWQGGFVAKEYLAIVHGHPPQDAFAVDAAIGRDESAEVSIRDRVRPDGAAARTRFRVLRRLHRDGQPFALVAAWLDTGRKHQIRIHLAHLGHPVVGDKLYGGDEGLYLAFVQRRLTADDKARLFMPCHALHASRLWFPWEGVEREHRAEPEGWFTAFLRGEEIPWLADPYDPLRSEAP